MGCVASKLEEEEEVVSICKERKRQLKQAVDRRLALAESHCRYCQSLYAVSAAIKLFVARHTSATSTFLITLPPHSPSLPLNKEEEEEGKNLINNPIFLEEKVSDSTTNEDNNTNNIACESCDSSTTSSDSSEEEECKEEAVNVMQQQHQHQHQQQQQHNYSYYYMHMPPQAVIPQSPSQDFGWDFFNPFDGMRPEIMSGYRRSLDDDFRAVREQEGIPELEEEEVSRENGHEQRVFVAGGEGNGGREGIVDNGDVGNAVDGNAGCVEEKGHSVMESPEKGRELLDALKDIEDHFVKAYDSGKDVSRMLEANKVYLQTGQEEVKENANKIILALPWHRSTSFKPSSCKSLVASSSRSTSTWTEYANDLFDGCGGMNSGSHSSTLGRLYAWEKKLYQEVKAGDATRKLYEKKCSKLRSHDVRGVDEVNMDKTRAALKDLYARILVAIRSAESISNRIEKLRDEELQPQIVELLKG